MLIRIKVLPPNNRSGFTLIELLVVIAIIAILSVVVILALNPAELLRQSRDSNRLSDLATMNSAIGVYAAQGGTSFGNTNTIYVSVPDPSATSTAGDQCQGLGLPTAPSGTSYFCEASSSYRNVNGTGWIPINFSNLSAGSPLGSLPQDPINTTTTGNYYTYATNGSQFIVTSLPESSKTKSNLATNPQIPNYPEVMAQGSNLTISPLWSPTGLVGYWNFEEGSGTTAIDQSGNGYNGTWNGSTTNGSYYTGGKVGSYAGNFDGSTNYIRPNLTLAGLSTFSVSFWMNPTMWNGAQMPVDQWGLSNSWDIAGSYLGFSLNTSNGSANTSLGSNPSLNTWTYITVTYDGSNIYIYKNGSFISSHAQTGTVSSNGQNVTIAGQSNLSSGNFAGLIDDIRIYNRALSASEIQALYNAEK